MQVLMQHFIPTNGSLGQLPIRREVPSRAAHAKYLCTTGSRECVIRSGTNVKLARY
jgi:hypothetical protein